MKTYAIIPIFIPHQGCHNDCVFCNQNVITARTSIPTVNDVDTTIDTYLDTLNDRNLGTIEVAFFGGSFTGLNPILQEDYLSVAKSYKDSGKIDKIHLSTRPDYIDIGVLARLKKYGVDIIELGVQSFDEDVLKASKRGHDASCVFNACKLIKSHGFTLGIQLMLGLPNDSYVKCVKSAKITASIRPSIARLYPTLVLPNTKLAKMLESGEYTPFSEAETIATTKAMYEILDDNGINIIRVGLKSTDLINNELILAGEYHPAFRQIVESEIARDRIEILIKNTLARLQNYNSDSKKVNTNKIIYPNTNCKQYQKLSQNTIKVFANSKSLSCASGHNAINKKYFAKTYPSLKLKFLIDNNLKK